MKDLKQKLLAGSFADTQFTTAEQKKKALESFLRVLETRDLEKMDKNLYNHLHLHCGFIAHYDIHGFRAEYSGQEFRRFVQHFDQNNPNFFGWLMGLDAEYGDINRAMVKAATAMAPEIYKELDDQLAAAEVVLCKKLAEKHGLTLTL